MAPSCTSQTITSVNTVEGFPGTSWCVGLGLGLGGFRRQRGLNWHLLCIVLLISPLLVFVSLFLFIFWIPKLVFVCTVLALALCYLQAVMTIYRIYIFIYWAGREGRSHQINQSLFHPTATYACQGRAKTIDEKIWKQNRMAVSTGFPCSRKIPRERTESCGGGVFIQRNKVKLATYGAA